MGGLYFNFTVYFLIFNSLFFTWPHKKGEGRHLHVNSFFKCKFISFRRQKSGGTTAPSPRSLLMLRATLVQITTYVHSSDKCLTWTIKCGNQLNQNQIAQFTPHLRYGFVNANESMSVERQAVRNAPCHNIPGSPMILETSCSL